MIWHFDKIRRSISTAAIKDGMIYLADFSGFLHCLDVKTGKPFWTHDMFAAIWGSPILINDKVYLGDEDGDVAVVEHSKTFKLVAEHEHGQLRVCDAGAGERQAVHHESQSAVRAARRRTAEESDQQKSGSSSFLVSRKRHESAKFSSHVRGAGGGAARAWPFKASPHRPQPAAPAERVAAVSRLRHRSPAFPRPRLRRRRSWRGPGKAAKRSIRRRRLSMAWSTSAPRPAS